MEHKFKKWRDSKAVEKLCETEPIQQESLEEEIEEIKTNLEMLK